MNYKVGDFLLYEEHLYKEYVIIISIEEEDFYFTVKVIKSLSEESEKTNMIPLYNTYRIYIGPKRNHISLVTDQNIINMLNKIMVFQ